MSALVPLSSLLRGFLGLCFFIVIFQSRMIFLKVNWLIGSFKDGIM